MFVHTSPTRKVLALFLSVSLVQIALAASACPNSYHVAYSNGQCVCQHGNNDFQPINPQCTWSATNGQCTVTCPTGSSGDANSRRRRQLQLLFNEDGSISNCPRGQTSCPITNAHGSRHECVNIKSDLDNCGGCAATGKGAVCGKERGVRAASCDGGICYIHSCRSGYRLDMHEQKCAVKH